MPHKGIRLAQPMSAAVTTAGPSLRPGRLLRSTTATTTTHRPATQLVRFLAIGWASTGVHWVLFLTLQPVLPLTLATLVALTTSTLVNTAAQRRFAFSARESREEARRDHVMSLVAFGASWLLSLWALQYLLILVPDASAIAQMVVTQACTLVGSAIRFVLLRTWHASAGT